MKWLRLPIALFLFWLIWWVFPVKSWQIEKDRLHLQSTKNLKALPINQKILLEARIYPNQKDVRHYDDAFIYERLVKHKASGTATETDIFAAERPSVELMFQDSSSLILPQGYYVLRTRVNNETPSSTLSSAEYLPKLRVAKENYELRLANPLAEREQGENIEGSLTAKGFREGDSVLLYASVQPQGRIKAEIMDRGGLKQHQQDMEKQERTTFWLALLLRCFLSLIPLGILQGLWKRKK